MAYGEISLLVTKFARVSTLPLNSGLWSVIATGLFLVGGPAKCNLHAAFEGLCYCRLRLPQLVQYIASKLPPQLSKALVSTRTI